MGDFNSQVGPGKREEKCVLGRYCFERRNKRGERLVELYTENNLEILNTVRVSRKKREERQLIWAQIDYILTSGSDRFQRSKKF